MFADEIIPTPKPKDFVCPSKNGKYAHERDCGVFYLCEKKKYKLYRCNKGKLYHEQWQSCVDEENVNCGSRIHPDSKDIFDVFYFTKLFPLKK